MTHHTDEAVLAKAKQLHSFDYAFFATAWDDLPAVVQVGFMQLAAEALAKEPEPGQRLFECFEAALAEVQPGYCPVSWSRAAANSKPLWALTEAKYLAERPAAEPAPEAAPDPFLAKIAELKELGRAVRMKRWPRSLDEVEDEVGLSNSTISRIERGESCSPASMKKIRAWLNA